MIKKAVTQVAIEAANVIGIAITETSEGSRILATGTMQTNLDEAVRDRIG